MSRSETVKKEGHVYILQSLSAVVFGSTFFFFLLPGRPEKLEVTQGMQLEQVKRKIPSVLFSWDTYTASREGRSGSSST